jgi:hypothetical protein
MDPTALPPHVSFPTGPAERPCPACGKNRAQRFYEVLGIPVHSCVLLSDQASAKAFPLADLSLAHCPDCGFLFNDRFDTENLDYGEDYEESQGCSATFRAFLQETGSKLIERSGLAGKPAIEVGCGRGDFLALLEELGAGSALGIDPSSTAGRALGADNEPVQVRHQLYGEDCFELPVQTLVCRHTLEHLPDVSQFAADANRHLQAAAGQYLFIEVPDVLRVLHEGAFWDIYHEHCSYFTAGSLERLALRNGFAPRALETAYAGQYLQLTAQVSSAAGPPAAVVKDLAEIESALSAFRSSCAQSIARLWALLRGTTATGAGPTCLWGAGSKATGFLTTLGAGEHVAAVVDIDPAKQGKFVAGTGHPIVGPEDLAAYAPALVLVMNPIYLDEIKADLRRLGIDAQVVAV